MLINLTLENFLSFRDPCTFSCLATGERQHRERLSDGPLRGQKFLPAAVLFGGNGSGKTNLIKSLHFVKEMALKGVGPDEHIPVSPFRLDPERKSQPSSFNLEILAHERRYRYTLVLDSTKVHKESLIELRTSIESVIFTRNLSRTGTLDWDLKGFEKLPADERKFVAFKSRDTLPNQLFIQAMRGKSIPLLDPVLEWFRDCLEVVEPETSIIPFELLRPDSILESFATSMLRHADTGISSVRFEALEFESLQLSEKDLKGIREHLVDNTRGVFLEKKGGQRIRIRYINGEYKADRMVTYHSTSKGNEVPFEIFEESHGTRQLIRMLPLLFGLIQPRSRKVFVCDELDSNLHPLIVQGLLGEFLTRCDANNRAQLIFASHDATLFDQRLLRRDEIWLINKKRNGATHLECLGDYKDVRNDTDIQKGYLLGRYSGVPRMDELMEVTMP